LRQFPPARIVCLTEETVETLYLLGEQDRIVGVSGYAVRPPQVRREKPRVSAFTSADIPKILALKPDLVLTFSDLQAEIAAKLIRAGIAVHAFNQRDVAGILAMIRTVGASVGVLNKAEVLARSYEARLGEVAALVRGRPKPKVYFEEWDDPLISGIGWVSELIEIATAEANSATRLSDRSLADRDLERRRGAAAHQSHIDSVSGAVRTEQADHISHPIDLLCVPGHDNVAQEQACARGGPSGSMLTTRTPRPLSGA
jgi:iron complex transport system substrate-binding protein